MEWRWQVLTGVVACATVVLVATQRGLGWRSVAATVGVALVAWCFYLVAQRVATRLIPDETRWIARYNFIGVATLTVAGACVAIVGIVDADGGLLALGVVAFLGGGAWAYSITRRSTKRL